MLGMGIYFHVHSDVYSTLTSETYYIGANLLIVGGCLLIVGGFLGCGAALWDNQLALLGVSHQSYLDFKPRYILLSFDFISVVKTTVSNAFNK